MRVTIADDHPLFLAGLTSWLTEIGIEVLGAARTADELQAMVRADPPDVAIVDISMPPHFEDEGLRAAETIATTAPGVGVLVISASRDADWAARLLRCRPTGVGYLLKHNLADVERLRDALNRIHGGGVAVDPDVVADLVARQAMTDALESLTPREREVLAHAAEGMSNRGIAQLLGIGERTVENHVTRIFHKLKLPDGNQRVLAILELQKAERSRLRGGW
jgi:RNA polymerase sigma factor (sigma-70 family)